MVYKTYASKCNTITLNSKLNTGLNPISELIYGNSLSRTLIYFDHNELLKYHKDGTYPYLSKFKHTLKITNSGSVDDSLIFKNDTDKIRATSFDIILFLIPKEWDNGKGFDYNKTINAECLSEDGSNWYQAQNGVIWEEQGVYSNDTLLKEYDKFSFEGHSEIIIGKQHFDIGNENIEIDVTNIFNDFINGNLPNYGFGIAFAPMFENTYLSHDKYISFFTHKTNTFFEPYIESIYNDYISDDRSSFFLDKDNKLYLYCNIGGNLTNLDELPTCSIDSVNYDVFHHSKGIYYINVNLPSTKYKPNIMLYDTWGNIIINGVKQSDVELYFTIKPNNQYFMLGTDIYTPKKVVPSIYGITENEKIFRNNDIRKVCITSRINYDRYKTLLLDNMQYRIYIMDGNRELTVIPFTNVNKSYMENYFLLNCNTLLPQKYHVDIKYIYNQEIITNKNILQFHIVDNIDYNLK